MKLFELFASLGLDTNEFNRGVQNANSKAADLAKTMGDKLKSFADSAAQLTKTAAVAASGIASLFITKSVKDFSEYEQLVGGIDTLFQDSSKKVQDYAAQAYKTAGLSANKYMEQVTGFSATLLRGLDGDTEAAAEAAHMAITDMADNVNKLGNDMGMVQNAYNGFMRNNYTMLDNLKLGYAGTQQGMADLINDSGVLGDTIKVTAETVKDVPFDMVIKGINIIQSRMGITGTTAAEATDTVAGSLATLRAAWTNLTTGAGAGHEMDDLVDNVIDAAENFVRNMLPVIERAASSMMTALIHAIDEGIPRVKAAFVTFWDTELPGIATKGANALITGINDIFGTNFPKIEQIDLPTWAEMQAGVSAWWADVKSKLQTLTSWTIGVFETPEATGTEMRMVMMKWWAETGLPNVKAACQWALNLFGVPIESDATIAQIIGGWWEAAGKVVKSVCTWSLALFGVPKETADDIVALLSSWWAGIKDIASAACQIVVGIATGDLGEAWEGIKKWWNTLVDTYGDMLQIGFDIIAPAIEELQKKLREWWENVKIGLGFSIELGADVHTTESGTEHGSGGRSFAVDGSHASGLDFVPYDNYIANLHRGEAVLTASEAQDWRGNSAGVEALQPLLQAILAELQAQRDRPIVMDGQTVTDLVSKRIARGARTSQYAAAT